MRQRGLRDEERGEALWRFSLALYARPGVAAALLALQDRAGREVNLILFCLWLGATRARRLDAARLVAAEAATGPIAAGVVRPLRELRRRLKDANGGAAEALRRRVLGLEIAAERQVQYRLAALDAGGAEPESDRLRLAEANLALYLGNDARSAEAAVLCRALTALMRRK